MARTIKAEDQRAAALSETYDNARIRLTAAEATVALDGDRVRGAESRLGSAKSRLQHAAIVAYVTGELSEVNSPLLSANLSSGEMTAVYAGAATGHLQAAVDSVVRIDGTLRGDRREAVAIEQSMRLQAEHLEALRRQASAMILKASTSYIAIRGRLLALVKQKAFVRIFAPWPKGSPYKGPNLAGSAVGTVADRLQQAAAAAGARKYLRVPYVWGGASKKGVDCSGLTMLAWAAAGITLSHSATLQWEESVPVPLDHLKAGDLLFYHFAHDGNTPITHVVEYLGAGRYGADTAIQAAQPGTVVSFTRVYFQGLVSAGQP